MGKWLKGKKHGEGLLIKADGSVSVEVCGLSSHYMVISFSWFASMDISFSWFASMDGASGRCGTVAH